MGGRHAFVDESKRGDYVVVAAVVVPAELVSIRRELRAMLLPGQSALHFKAEQDGRRRQLLAGISALPVEAYVYVSQSKNQVAGRKSCLQALVATWSPRTPNAWYSNCPKETSRLIAGPCSRRCAGRRVGLVCATTT
jgi:hypothetical protein